MSHKSTLLLTTCCHIYKDTLYPGGKELELLIVDVNESHHGYDSIEVEWSSDFAVMLRAMIDVCDKEQLDKICRNNFKFNK